MKKIWRVKKNVENEKKCRGWKKYGALTRMGRMKKNVEGAKNIENKKILKVKSGHNYRRRKKCRK